jgi:hypothetical protein
MYERTVQLYGNSDITKLAAICYDVSSVCNDICMGGTGSGGIQRRRCSRSRSVYGDGHTDQYEHGRGSNDCGL